MSNFIAVKIHYDHRQSLLAHLKYSRAATEDEHKEYLSLYRDENVGGEGFNECLNFSIPEQGTVQIYLPPTCLPGKKRLADDFMIFSFTYHQDREMPSRIIGVHAGTNVIGKDGKMRAGILRIPGVDLYFHAEAPTELSTLFTPPVEYDLNAGLYTPVFRKNIWGNGLRYITAEHAENIIQAALAGARSAIINSQGSRQLAIEREIDVLTNIAEQYTLSLDRRVAWSGRNNAVSRIPPMPDKELGKLGERKIFERELATVKTFGLASSLVEWVSQAIPQAPYDIKTVKKIGAEYRDHYLEVKSSKAENDPNIYISSGQVAFLETHKNCSSVVIVSFDAENEVKSIRDLSLSQIRKEFELIPIKYKLRSRGDG